MNANPLVTIVSPVHNGSAYLEDLLQSVLNQDYPRLEHVVIDDGSDDQGATVRILNAYPHVKWWTRENRGQYATQNEGLAAAAGSIVCIISADDMLAPGAVSAAVRYLLQNPNRDCVFGRVLDVDDNGELVVPQTRLHVFWAPLILEWYLLIPHCGLFFRRDMILRRDYEFDASYQYAGDWEWMIRMKRRGAKFGFIDRTLAFYRVHAGQTTSTADFARTTSEYRRVCRSYGRCYTIRTVIARALIARSLVIKTVYVLRQSGLDGLFRACLDWAARRLARWRRH